MRLTWFQAQGYKNLRSELRLDALGRINVLHGDNNVGKSNLLEAIGLFFLLLYVLREEGGGGPGLAERYARKAPPSAPGTTVRTGGYFAQRGYAPGQIFDLAGACPIALSAEIVLDADDLGEGAPAWLAGPIQIALKLERSEDDVTVTLVRAAREGGGEIPFDASPESDWTALAVRLRGRRGGGAPRFALIRADRTVVTELAPLPAGPSSLATREPLPSDLGLALHDAEGATGPARARFDRGSSPR